jgi:centractin
MQSTFRSFFNSSAIVDFGSGQTKTDDSREELPQFIFKSIVGRPKYNRLIGDAAENWVVSPEIERLGLFRINHPIKRGVLQSDDDMRALMSKVYSDLGYHNNKRPILYAEPIFSSKAQKKRIIKMGFESLETESILFANQCSLALYAFGKTDGLVLESGEGLTQVGVVYGGHKVDSACLKFEFGGQDVSSYLRKSLLQDEFTLHPTSEWHLLDDIKNQFLRVAKSKEEFTAIAEGKAQKNQKFEYKLPDGAVLSLTEKQTVCGELFFQPEIAGLLNPSIPEMLDSSVKNLESELKSTLIKNIYVSGGNTKIAGFDDRLAEEVNKGVSQGHHRKIVVPRADRACTVWQGGAVLTNLNSINKMWITMKEYEEQGDRILLIKSF